MKNSPENNFWNEVRDRLDHYAEEPSDDSWDKIAGAMKPRPRVIAWLERRSSSAQVSLAGFAVLVSLAAGDQAAATWRDPGVALHKDASVIAEQAPRATVSITTEMTGATTGSKRVQKMPRKTSGEASGVNADDATESRELVQPQLAASTQADADTAGEESPIAPSDEVQEKTNSVNPVHIHNQASTAVASVVDTTGQKDVNKKKKEQAVAAAREKKEAQKKKAQLHIPMVYFQVGPSLAYRKITPSKDDHVTITDVEEPGVFASDRIGLSVEAGFQYRVAPRLEVYGGLSYYHQNQHIRYTVADASAGSVGGNAGDGYTFIPVITKHDVNYTMRNAGVSAGVFYRIKTHLLEHKFGVGLLYQQGFQRASGEGATYMNNGSKYLQYQLQYRMEAGLTDRMRLYFQPGYTHAFHVDEKLNEPFEIKPYRAGISVGIVYVFNKK